MFGVKKKVKQVIIVFDDGSFKGYNWKAFKERLRNSLHLNNDKYL